MPAGDEYGASSVILFQETVRFISGSSAVLGKGHSGKCPRIRGGVGLEEKAGSLWDRSRCCQARHGCLEGTVLNAELWRGVVFAVSAAVMNKFLNPLDFRLRWEREKE